MKGVSTIVGGDTLRDAATFVQSLDSMFSRGFQERAERTYLAAEPAGHAVRRGRRAGARRMLREATFFVDRLSTEQMPLADSSSTGRIRIWTSISEATVFRRPSTRSTMSLTKGVLETVMLVRAGTACGSLTERPIHDGAPERAARRGAGAAVRGRRCEGAARGGRADRRARGADNHIKVVDHYLVEATIDRVNAGRAVLADVGAGGGAGLRRRRPTR